MKPKIRGIRIGKARMTDDNQLVVDMDLEPWVQPLMETTCIGIRKQVERGLLPVDTALELAEDMACAILGIQKGV